MTDSQGCPQGWWPTHSCPDMWPPTLQQPRSGHKQCYLCEKAPAKTMWHPGSTSSQSPLSLSYPYCRDHTPRGMGPSITQDLGRGGGWGLWRSERARSVIPKPTEAVLGISRTSSHFSKTPPVPQLENPLFLSQDCGRWPPTA